MYNDKIEYLKRAIKRTYKRYIGEIINDNATLIDVLNFFNISIDEARIDDYKINKIDYSTPSVEVIDKKDNTLFVAEYTNNSDLLNCSGGEIKFIKLSSVNAKRRIDSLFYIGNETPIIEKMTFTNGDYDLVFEREMPNSVGLFSKDGIKFVVRYLQNLEYDGRNVQQQLLAKIFTNKYNGKEPASTFEQEYTYSSNNFVIKKNSQDKYAYISNGNIIYGINEFELEGICHYLNGVCFENANVDVSKYLPFHINSNNKIFGVNNAKSIMIFKGGTDDAIHHSLTISKIGNLENDEDKQRYDIYLNYEAIRWECFNDENCMPQQKKVVVTSKTSRYSKTENGNVTSLEIKNIIDDLNSEFKDNTFIQLVIKELQTFANKMNIQKGISQEKLDLLSPKLFIDKSVDEICSLVSSNQDYYFKLVAEQFGNLTNGSSLEKKGQIKVLKQNSQSGTK